MISTIDIGFAKFSSNKRELLEHYYQSVLGLNIAAKADNKSYFCSRTGAPAFTLTDGDLPLLNGITFKIDNETETRDILADLKAHVLDDELQGHGNAGIGQRRTSHRIMRRFYRYRRHALKLKVISRHYAIQYGGVAGLYAALPFNKRCRWIWSRYTNR